ncbi:MAG: hypothetical protein JRG94_20200 [Deltaproteobacteria bacterium]|nr:hypothetical protein [Deltaproteobacteria bacterium]
MIHRDSGILPIAVWRVVVCAAVILVASSPESHGDSDPSRAEAEATAQVAEETDRLYGLALEHWLARSSRLQQVAQRLQIAGRDICDPILSPILGASIVDLKLLQENLQPAARTRFGSEHRHYVTAVFAGTAAERGGLRVGDAVLTLNGSRVKGVERFYGFRRRSEVPNRLEIERGGESLTLSIETELGCRYPAWVVFDNRVNAAATGSSITFNSALMRVLPDDAMLAQVVGHELAHNIFWSSSITRRGGWASRKSEARADYVGVYLSALAGYPLVTGHEFQIGLQQRLESFMTRTSHPTTPARVLALRKTIEEIEQKQERGEPLELRFE